MLFFEKNMKFIYLIKKTFTIKTFLFFFIILNKVDAIYAKYDNVNLIKNWVVKGMQKQNNPIIFKNKIK